MFAIVNDQQSVRGVGRQLLYVQIFTIRRSCSPPRDEQGGALCGIAIKGI
jgi:hypothetical protein